MFVAAIALPIAAAHAQSGIASHYSDLSTTASGRSYSSGAMVAAHRSHPFGTKLRVKNLRNGRSVVVTVVDRGPFVKGRIIDLSKGAANALGFSGLQRVDVAVIGKGSK
jgi:rare lipoprotein A